MFKQIVKLISSSFAGQAINLAVLLTVARLVIPTEFGAYLLGLTVTTYIIVVASAKYHHAIFILNDSDAELLATGSRFFCAFMSLIAVIILSFVNLQFDFWPELNLTSLILIGIAGYFSATNLFFYYLALKKNEIKKIMFSRVISPFVGGIAMVAMAWFYSTSEALLIGYVFTLFLANYFISPGGLVWIGVEQFVSLLRANKRFPVLLLPAGVLETLNASYLMMAATYFFGVESAAFIGMYYRLVASPQGMICRAISDIYRKKVVQLSEQNDTTTLVPFFFKSITYLCGLSLLAAIALFVFSEYGIEFVLGDEWLNSKKIFISFIPMFVVTFIVSPLTSILYVRDGQKFDLIVQIFFITLLFLYHITVSNITINDFVFGYSFIVIAKYMLELFFCYKCISNSHIKSDD